MSNQWDDLIAGVLDEVVALRRDLHAHPELSRKEHETARKVRGVLERLANIKVLPPFIETDVVAVLNPGKDGPCVGLRADMDALPIEEDTGLSYASKNVGVMHACGHDGHTANLVGTAMVLSQVANELPGRVVFIFQPDEEDTGGGGRLCAQGMLEQLGVEGMLALHGSPQRPVGSIAFCRGAATAANNAFEITVTGRGGHGASPHRTVDPIVIGAHVITALQTIVSRVVDPLNPAVVTVGQVKAGSACNVIPNHCWMQGTLRFTQPAVSDGMKNAVRIIAEQTAQAHGGQAEVVFHEGYPPLENDDSLVNTIAAVGKEMLGQENVASDEPPSMGVEDFAFYARHVPSALFRLGVRPLDQKEYPTLHSAQFDFNDDALPVGMKMLCELARRYLVSKSG